MLWRDWMTTPTKMHFAIGPCPNSPVKDKYKSRKVLFSHLSQLKRVVIVLIIHEWDSSLLKLKVQWRMLQSLFCYILRSMADVVKCDSLFYYKVQRRLVRSPSVHFISKCKGGYCVYKGLRSLDWRVASPFCSTLILGANPHPFIYHFWPLTIPKRG